MNIEELRRHLDGQPEDAAAQAELGRQLLARGEREAAAGAFYQAACAAQRSGDTPRFRELLALCLEAEPDHPLLFTAPPGEPKPPSERGARVLLVHPESRVRRPLKSWLEDNGFVVTEAGTLGSARIVLEEQAPEAILSAPTLSDGSAEELFRAARRAAPGAATILLTSAARGERIEHGSALAPLVDEHVDRPLDPVRLIEALNAALWRQRHAVAGPAEPGPPRPAGWARGADSLRSLLIVAAGYTLLLALHAFLEARPGSSDPPVEVSPRAPLAPEVPPELKPEEQRLLWTRLTSTESSADTEVQVTCVTRELAAARIWRQLRQDRSGTAPPRAEVEARLQALHLDEVARFEIHIAARSARGFEPVAAARSTQLLLEGETLTPIELPRHEQLRYVRESGKDAVPLTRSLGYTVGFRRERLARAEVFALRIDVGGVPHTVYIARSQLGND